MKSIKEIFNKEMVRVFKDKNTSRLSMFKMNRKVLKNF